MWEVIVRVLAVIGALTVCSACMLGALWLLLWAEKRESDHLASRDANAGGGQ